MEVETICGVYSLTHLNGKKAPASATLCLTKDGDSILAYILVANVIKGKVKFENGRLTGMLLSAMSAGDKNQMIVEDAVTGGFGSGFDVRKDLNRLLLKNENNALIFLETIKLEDIFGNHSVVTVDGETPKKQFSIKFTRDEGGANVTASLGIPLRGTAVLKDGVLQGSLEATIPDADEYLVPLAKKILSGFGSGFQIKKTDTGLLLKCSEGAVQLRSIVGRKDLKGEFIFKSMDGAPISDKQMFLSFTDGEELGISAQMVNQLKGVGLLENNVLRSEEFFASTRMMGSEEEMKAETGLVTGMTDGYHLSLIGNQLTMKGPKTYVLLRVAHVDAALKGPTYKGTHAVKCFKTEGNGLLFRIINEVDDHWAFYNDTTDYRMHVHATFGSRSSIKPLGNAKLEKDENDKHIVEITIEPLATEMFIAGKVNGFKMLYSAEPLESW